MSLSVKCDDLPWRHSRFAEGLLVQDIATAGGLEMQLVRMRPGAQIPLHKHELPEFIYLLAGELEIADQTLSQGWAHVAAPDSEHSDVRSPTGCTFVLVDRPS